MSINSVIRMITLIIVIIIIIVKSFSRYVQIDFAIISDVLRQRDVPVGAAGEIIEINANTYALIGVDFNWMLAGTNDERFVVSQLPTLVRVADRVGFERNALALLIRLLLVCCTIKLIETFCRFTSVIYRRMLTSHCNPESAFGRQTLLGCNRVRDGIHSWYEAMAGNLRLEHLLDGVPALELWLLPEDGT